MGTLYETDTLAWSTEQARLLRRGEWAALDIANLAEEIEDVGRSERRELGERVALLLEHLLRWQYEPPLRSRGWSATITVERRAIARKLSKSASLERVFHDDEWLESVWDDALIRTIRATGLHDFPDCPLWSPKLVLAPGFLPD